MKGVAIIIGLLMCLESLAQIQSGEELKKQKYYDSSLNKMRLRDPDSIEKQLERPSIW